MYTLQTVATVYFDIFFVLFVIFFTEKDDAEIIAIFIVFPLTLMNIIVFGFNKIV